MDQRLAPVAFSAPAVFRGAPATDGVREFSGVAYGGGVITDHPYLDAVVFDLASTRFETPAPALYGHFDPIGVVSTAEIDRSIEIKGRLFQDQDGNARKVAAFADRGMPWQLSVGIWPGRIEEVKAGASVQLNGQSFNGPLTVFRDNRVREVSFVALGADRDTSATVFTAVTEGGARRPDLLPQQPKEHSMTTIAKEEHDRIVADLTASVAAEKQRAAALEAQFTASRRAARATAVKDLFQAIGQEYTDDVAKPYLDMDEATFAAVAADLRKRPARDPKLFSSQAKDGPQDDGAAPKSAQEFVAKAQAYVAEQAAVGVTITPADAVAHVRAKFAAAA